MILFMFGKEDGEPPADNGTGLPADILMLAGILPAG
jgi:hypothetical protein